MMQETNTMGPVTTGPWDILSGQSLVALLALVGAKRMEVESLRTRIKLTPFAFGNLLGWLQREYLVDVVSTLDGERVEEKVGLTDKGESVLVSMLEQTCEQPELH
jgi:hypothetical protein